MDPMEDLILQNSENLQIFQILKKSKLWDVKIWKWVHAKKLFQSQFKKSKTRKHRKAANYLWKKNIAIKNVQTFSTKLLTGPLKKNICPLFS